MTDLSAAAPSRRAPALAVGPRPIHTGACDAAWWRDAVIYQVYPRSWADGDGDGIGDLPGITARLPYLRSLGVDAIWISPFYPSPQADGGYDVANYRDIDPLFGSLADADALFARAHQLGLKVIVDLVPNHSSDEHPWFQAALAAVPGSRERERYVFRDGLGERGALPPNNWRSVFGGPAWTRAAGVDGAEAEDRQWYLHVFDRKQPDFNWEHPQVRAEFEDILRFWLDRGIDGFRVDVAHSLVKEAGLPDWHEPQHAPMWDQDGVHEIYRAWRRILNSYNPTGSARHDRTGLAGRDPQADRILCAEAWVQPQQRVARYVRPDEMHQAFNFDFLQTAWIAREIREVVEASFAAADSVGAPTTWVLSNHDVVRHASRLGLPIGAPRPNGIGIGDPQPDAEVGLRRARAATALMLALPGSAYLYQGEELGLPDSTDLPDEVRQDPTWTRSGHTERGRDGCRVPMPWEAAAPSYGFGPSDRAWLPQPTSYRALAVDQQVGAAGSTVELYRAMLTTRRVHGLGTGTMSWLEGYGDDVVAFVNTGAGSTGSRLAVVANLGPQPVPLPEGAEVLVASGPLASDGLLPTDTTAWLRW